jgi:hypothetical protein
MKQTIEFEVISQSKQLDEVGKLMSGMDLGITDIKGPIKETYSWKTSKTINREYISKSKKAIKEAVDKTGFRLISIKKLKNKKDE